ncbi:Relaxase/Mobilization nuclease domain protein [Botrimarina colliarenosi]|uniref:Relaxase/Mobilization nuclease domain protein n=1 Tax=Botrimarina colliarenosi TaxID=2528001 RepID=A0A5C6A7G3_9BACT|nr:relaxase/mobilization nuclease domain-containing protein [Botrimarina colliarenosi]TWT95376.1 Relaxase/Mobilization nuclease domain protein [Botrimarina colliarenosi]
MFVEITRGRSFAGLARYCLHDEGRLPTSERVDFAVTRNVATDDPQVAWRLMVAKDYQRDRLKEEAGVGRGGRKDGRPVGHLVLSWKREEAEAERLDRERMIRAAEEALRAIGAAEREAIIVAHNDTHHPHLHVILCLIEDDGRLKTNWKEREKLSRWALERERRLHGEALVKKREENWEARGRGETPAPVRKRPRHLYELVEAARRNPALRSFVRQHLRDLRELERRKEASLKLDQERRRVLLKTHVDRRDRLQREHADRLAAIRSEVRREHRQRWRELLNEQEASRRLFERNERTLRGRVANTFRAVDWKSLVRRERGRGQRTAMAEAFDAARDEGMRRRGLRRKQEREKAMLAEAQRGIEKRRQAEAGRRRRERDHLGRMAFLRLSRRLAAWRSREVADERERQSELTRERNEAMRESRQRTWAERAAAKLRLSRREKRKAEAPPLKLSPQERAKPLDIAGGSGTHGDGRKAVDVARQMDEGKAAIKKRTRRERKPRKPRGGRGDRGGRGG